MYRTAPTPNPPRPNRIFFQSEFANKYKLTSTARMGTVQPSGILNVLFIPRLLKTMMDRHVGIYWAKREITDIANKAVNEPVRHMRAVKSPETMIEI